MGAKNTVLRYIVSVSIILAFVVIILGSFTRLSDAGLGCPDWPGCYGHLLWPNSAEEISVANQKWPDAQVETHKTWPEMVHRYFASSLGLLAVVILLFAVKYRKTLAIKPHLPMLILTVVILQGMFGMWTVTLKLWPQVVTAHLLGGFTVLSLLWWLREKLRWQASLADQIIENNKQGLQQLSRYLPYVWLGLAIVFIQIALGGWTTSNYAAVACPDFPMCQQQWLPPMDFAQGFNVFQHIGPNYLGGLMDNSARVAIHMSHRIGALVTCIYLIVMSVLLLNTGVKALQAKIFAVLAVLLLQLSLGISNIVFDFPLSVAVAHNAIGALLLLRMVSLLFATYRQVR